MHEAGAVTRAIAATLDGPGGSPPPRRLRMVIRDPLRAHPDSVLLYATECLRDRGVAEPVVTVEVAPVACAACGSLERPSPTEPACAGCGMPLRPVEGPAVVAEEA